MHTTWRIYIKRKGVLNLHIFTHYFKYPEDTKDPNHFDSSSNCLKNIRMKPGGYLFYLLLLVTVFVIQGKYKTNFIRAGAFNINKIYYLTQNMRYMYRARGFSKDFCDHSASLHNLIKTQLNPAIFEF